MAYNVTHATDLAWAELLALFGGNAIAAAAFLGNIADESGGHEWACEPSRPESVCHTYIRNVDTGAITENEFVRYGCSATGDCSYSTNYKGFGLCQWTYYTRKQMLYDFWEDYGGSIGDAEMQVAFLVYELNVSFSGLVVSLQTMTDIREATALIMKVFEGPGDQSEATISRRTGYAEQYLAHYGGGGLLVVTVAVEGNGQARATPTTGKTGDKISISARPGLGDVFLEWRIDSGDVILYYNKETSDNAFNLGDKNVRVVAVFTGETPPTPPPVERKKGYRVLAKRMKIWQYPTLRRR